MLEPWPRLAICCDHSRRSQPTSGGELLHSSLRFARAVLSEPEEIERRFEEALSTDLTAWPFTRARLLLTLRRPVATPRGRLRVAGAATRGQGRLRCARSRALGRTGSAGASRFR